MGKNLLCLSPLDTWCLMLMFEAVGTLGRARSQAGRRLLAWCPWWGNGHHPSSASGRSSAWGVCAAPSKYREHLCAFQGQPRPAGPGLMLGFPSPLQLGPFLVWSPVCVAWWGKEERRASMGSAWARCLLASLPGPGRAGAARTPNAFRIYELLVLFCFLYFAFSFNSPLLSRSHGITEMNPSPGSLPHR